MWQATAQPPSSALAASAGGTAVHTASANGQRVRNRQPEGGLIGLAAPCTIALASGRYREKQILNQRHLMGNRKFVDSLLEGRVTSELVSEVDSGARKNQNQIFRGFWMIPAS